MARILITSAIPYINGIKHLGNLVGTSCRPTSMRATCAGRGHEVLFICATDEHGTPAELAAAKAGQHGAPTTAPRCMRCRPSSRSGFRLSFDQFGRSSSPQNRELTQHFAGALDDQGLIEEVTDEQVYSVADGRFLPDRYVEGTCPNCGYDERARRPVRELHQAARPDRPDQPAFGDLGLDRPGGARHQAPLPAPVEAAGPARAPGSTRKARLAAADHLHRLEMAGRRRGLQDRGITRDLDWGVPVQADGKPGRGWRARSSTSGSTRRSNTSARPRMGRRRQAGSDWERWWRTDKGADDVRYIQFMGKDNVPFHTLSFPVTILGAGRAAGSWSTTSSRSTT